MLWPYKIRLPFELIVSDYPQHMTTMEFRTWCAANLKKEWRYLTWSYQGNQRVALLGFQDEDDAMMTKLAWS